MPFQVRLANEAKRFAADHFTDPELTLPEAAIFKGVNERTLRVALTLAGTSWPDELLPLRMARAAEILRLKPYKISDVALLCGYRSRATFSKHFQDAEAVNPKKLDPSVFRDRAKRSRVRRQRRIDRQGQIEGHSPAWVATWLASVAEELDWPTTGAEAIRRQRRREAEQRVSDRNLLLYANPFLHRDDEEVVEWEIESPQRMTADPERWRALRRDFDDYLDRNGEPPKAAETRKQGAKRNRVVG